VGGGDVEGEAVKEPLVQEIRTRYISRYARQKGNSARELHILRIIAEREGLLEASKALLRTGLEDTCRLQAAVEYAESAEETP
jgi:hypothetical protein